MGSNLNDEINQFIAPSNDVNMTRQASSRYKSKDSNPVGKYTQSGSALNHGADEETDYNLLVDQICTFGTSQKRPNSNQDKDQKKRNYPMQRMSRKLQAGY